MTIFTRPDNSSIYLNEVFYFGLCTLSLNLSHCTLWESLYEVFDAAEAIRIAKGAENRYILEHGS